MHFVPPKNRPFLQGRIIPQNAGLGQCTPLARGALVDKDESGRKRPVAEMPPVSPTGQTAARERVAGLQPLAELS